jgi:large subunit ribosomal protein L18
MALTKIERRERIRKRIKKVVSGSQEVPRLSVFRSNTHIYVQFVDDVAGKTLLTVSSKSKDIASIKGNKTEKAALVGKSAAEKALAVGIHEVKFDRGGYLYHGRVKAVAEAARVGGLKF